MIAKRVNPSLTFNSPFFFYCPALYDFQLRRCVLQTFLDFDSTERLLDAVVLGGLKTFVQLPEKFWRRFGAPLNEKSAQLVVFTTRYADFGGERGSRTYAFKKYHKIANH